MSMTPFPMFDLSVRNPFLEMPRFDASLVPRRENDHGS